MKKCFIDSNGLIYFKDSLSRYHAAVARKLLKLISANVQLCISPLVIDEFLYVFLAALKQQKISPPYKELKRALREILQIPLISIVNSPIDTSAQLQAVDYMEKFNLKPSDAYHLVTMISNKINSFVTFDTDFSKVFAAKILTKA